jgi:aminopeptidase N
MGHPVLRVTKQYDAGSKQLSLTVRQEQKPDPASAYPQVDFFELPLDVEIGTASNTRIERVVIEPKAEQTFTFKVDSDPLLVNFDYQSTLIKELTFDKPVDELVYQLSKDQDVLGRIWALNRLAERIKDKKTADADKPKIVSALAAALTGDKFWGVRGDTATALNGVDNPAVRAALISAAKDPDARVRARSIRTLSGFKDPSLAPVFMEHLNDPSYAAVRAAATGLGNSKAPGAFDAFVKLMDAPSWRDTIKSAALSGLASLGDKRALDLGFRYAAKGNQTSVRSSALAILGAVGKDDPRTFPFVSEIFSRAIETGTFQLTVPAARALASIGDPRAVAVLEEGAKKTDSPQLKALILQAVNEVKK